VKELQIQSRYSNQQVARAPLIPKFASEVATIACELRNRDTSVAVQKSASLLLPARHADF
jgi:hypothetical protein